MRLSVTLFRNDLRLLDNYVVTQPNSLTGKSAPTHWLPVFCFDPAQVDADYVAGREEFPSPTCPQTFVGNFPKSGRLRTKFLVESVLDLRNNLRNKGSDLLIAFGKPASVTMKLFEFMRKKCGSAVLHSVYCQKEISSEELDMESTLNALLPKDNLKFVWGSTMFHIEDVKDCPDTFTAFRKICETKSHVRDLAMNPSKFLPFPREELDLEIFARENLDIFPVSADRFSEFLKGFGQLSAPPGATELEGGETHAINRLNWYTWQTDLVKKYKDTRNQPSGLDSSTKFSSYLALGCISPRYIFHELKRYERARGESDGSYWVIFELLWRDFFKFIALKYGDRLFYSSGLRNNGIVKRWRFDEKLFFKWAEGKTGIPWVDAAMRELKTTGFMSNRLRQNVSSFLVHSLGIDWRYGAAWFESNLVDFDVHSNYGNWLYIAGAGNDPRENRKFNMIKQARDYDPTGQYVKAWISELASIPDGDDRLFVPWKFPNPYISPIIIEPEWSRYLTGKSGRNTNEPRKSDWKVKRF